MDKVKPIKMSVFLTPQHREAVRREARRAGQSATRWVSGLVASALARKKERKIVAQ